VGSKRLDLPRISLATILAAGLALGLALIFLRHAQSRSHVGPTSATLDEAFSLLVGAALGLGLGGGVAALAVRHGSRALAGLIAGLLAYILVLAPVFVYTDDVGLDEDLNAGGLGFLAFLAVPLAASSVAGAFVGELIARLRHPARTRS
jgi:hypothetical protein